jgi:sulfide dehydrogenase [flavocytochrome c] flavoprotein chain
MFMDALRLMTRRNVVGGAAASAAAFALPRPSRAQSAARIVVIGGGFGGASCARALKRIDAKFEVALIEPNRIFVACPFSNEVIAGLRDLEAQQFSYDRIAAEGVSVIAQAATKIDAKARAVGLADGTLLNYDRLVLSPGIDLRLDALPGYDEAAMTRMPHAWKAGAQTALLRRQLEAMDDGGLVALAVPASPSRCPPAPYERASLIAHYLKTKKPRSKILILDAKDVFPQQHLFETAWKELYPGMIERVSLSQGGRVTSVDPATNTIVTDFGNYTAHVANVIPPQWAGRIADIAGAVDNTGWCPIDPVTFASKLVPDIHVIGDACFGGTIPKSASAANAQGKACAEAVARLIAGKSPEMPRLVGVCYNTVAPGYAFSQSGVYQAREGAFAEVEGLTTSPVDAPREVRTREADEAKSWYRTITVDAFG